MGAQDRRSTPLVLLVTRHAEFALAVSRQLLDLDFAVQALLPEEAAEINRFRDAAPEIALVDYDARTAEELPLYKAIGNAVQDCQIVLICTERESPAAAQLVRVWEVFDYVLTDAMRDPNRIPLLVERALTNCLAKASESPEDDRLRQRRVLEMLADVKAILTTGTDNPIVKAVHDYTLYGSVPGHCEEPFGPDLGRATQCCLVDLICGKLRRLENEMLLSGEAADSSSIGKDSHALLIVDDDLISSEVARHILEGNGYDVITASTTEAARRAIIRNRPSLVLMDVHLGADNGLQLVQLMRRSREYRDIPIIVVTADRLRDTLFDAVGMNIQGYLLKPYQPNTLIEKVKIALKAVRPSAPVLPAAVST